MSWMAAAASVAGSLIDRNSSGKMSQSQKNMINKQVEIAGDLRGIGQGQQELYDQYSGDIYDGIFEEIGESPDIEGARGRATADVNQAFNGLEERTQRNNFRYGVNPASGRYQDSVRRNGVDRSLALVGSQNKAQRDEEDKHWARMLTGANITQGFINNSVNAGGAAIGGYGSAGSGYGNLSQQYSNSANNGMQAAGYWINKAMNDNGGGAGDRNFQNNGYSTVPESNGTNGLEYFQ